MTTSLAALCGLEFSKTRCRRCCGVEVQRSSGPGRFSRVVPSGPRARLPTRPISAEMSSPYFWAMCHTGCQEPPSTLAPFQPALKGREAVENNRLSALAVSACTLSQLGQARRARSVSAFRMELTACAKRIVITVDTTSGCVNAACL